MADAHVVAPEHEHSPHLRHHFDDMEQQFDSATLGMWVFLLTEIMFFGGMFCAYSIYRSMYPEAFASTSQYMNPKYGAFNTAVLIVSSLSMALAVRAAVNVAAADDQRDFHTALFHLINAPGYVLDDLVIDAVQPVFPGQRLAGELEQNASVGGLGLRAFGRRFGHFTSRGSFSRHGDTEPSFTTD